METIAWIILGIMVGRLGFRIYKHIQCKKEMEDE